MQEAKLTVTADVSKALVQLAKISNQFKGIEKELGALAKEAAEQIDNGLGKTEKKLTVMQRLAEAAGKGIKKSFANLIDIAAVAGGFQFGKQIGKSITETVALSDAVRKLSASFGIATDKRKDFQATLTKGLAKYGLSSEEAAGALQGLAGQGVTGADTVTSYATKGAQLASIGGETGNTGAITKGLAEVVRARGGSVQDTKAVDEIASVVAKAMETTGKSASEILASMEHSFENMTEEMKKVVSAKGMAQVATAAAVAGPGVEGLFEKITGAGLGEKQRQQAFGLDKLIDKQGNVNLGALQGIEEKINGLAKSVGVTKASEIVGGDEASGKALMHLIHNADRVGDRFKALDQASGDVTAVQQKNMGLTESLNANFNKVKGEFASFGSAATQGLTDFFTDTSKSDIGAAAVTFGGGMASAAGSLSGAAGIAGAIGLGTGGGGLGSAVVGGASALGLPAMLAAGGVGMAGYAGYKAMSTSEGRQALATGGSGQGGSDPGMLGDSIIKLANAINSWVTTSKKPIKVESVTRDLKDAKQPTRGATQ